METFDGPCRSFLGMGKLPGLVGFQEVYAIYGNVFCTSAAAHHPSYRSCPRSFIGVGSSGGSSAVFVIGGIKWHCLHSTQPSGIVPSSLPDPVQSRLHRLSRIHRLEVPGPIPGPVTRLQAVYRPGTHCPAITRAVHRPGTRRLAVPGPVSRPFPVLFPDLSPVWRPSHRPGHVSRPFPDLSPV